MTNETLGSNVFAQRFAIDDFDGDGNTELVAGDSEGDLFIYESAATTPFQLEWQTQLPLKNITQLASGDLTGDGIPEFVVGGLLSLPDNPSGPSLWKFFVFTHTPRGYARLTEGEREATLAIAPHRRNANSLAIADLDRDGTNNLIIATYPNLYVTQWDGTAFKAVWHQRVEKTPMLFTADLNQNRFNEFYANLEDGIYRFESVFATDPDGVERLTPWNVEAKPLTQKTVQVTWTATSLQTDGNIQETNAQPANLPTFQSFTVYRAEGEKEETPADNAFEKIRENLTVTRFLDRRVTTDNTYWYAITTKDTNGNETPRTEPVAATPRKPPQLIRAAYHHPGEVGGNPVSVPSEEKSIWVIVTYDRRMNLGIADESRYVLRKLKRIDGVNPVSAIRDRMGRRALLAFDTESLLAHFGQPLTATDQYEISVSNVADIDENAIRGATHPLEIPSRMSETAISDLTQVRVYPNPVRPNVTDKGVITFDRIPIGTRIQLFTAKGELLETLDVTEQDHNRKQWWLTSNNTADVSTGIYIYVLEFDTQKKIGKIAVIK